MADLGELIQGRRRALGLTLEALASRAGCAKSYLSLIENGRRANPPSEAVLRRLERALGFHGAELLSAARWMNTPAPIRREVAALHEGQRSARRLVDLLRQRGVDDAWGSGELASLVDAISPSETGSGNVELAPRSVRAPLINKVAAGYPTEFTDLDFPARVADEYVSAPGIDDADAFAARVVGDSMEPKYVEGDIVVFSPARDTPEGSDCFVRFEASGETTFKRVFFESGAGGGERIRLQPLNARYAPRVVAREEIGGLYAAACVVRAV